MKDIQDEIQKNTQASIIVGLVTMVLVAFLLRVFMRVTVLKPLDITEHDKQEMVSLQLYPNVIQNQYFPYGPNPIF